ncbi:MAG: bile acid:sodium symporter family protein [Gloeomargaritaceae cyanobacterium C42_A2020_066]|nr:bile acid:sodium symporter family protein [Gloeomargaritaceae cyanobacterium C42_A2020_066]
MLRKVFTALEQQFLLLALGFAGLALIHPPAFTWLTPFIPQLLGIVMFGMGMTLEVADFIAIWDQKSLIAVGVFLQFLIMPLLGWGLATLLQLPRDAFIGLVIVGACPGGTASNVITYLAKGNVALSVVLTLSSTLLAPLLTPLLIALLARTQIDLAPWPLMVSIVWIVLVPLVGGLMLRHVLRRRLQPILALMPGFSVLLVVLIIASVFAQNQQAIMTFPLTILLAVALHNGLGLGLGYWGSRLFGMAEQNCRTVAIEVGMQNSGLGVALATQFVNSAAALPPALFSLWHNLSGAVLAKVWSRSLPSPGEPSVS